MAVRIQPYLKMSDFLLSSKTSFDYSPALMLWYRTFSGERLPDSDGQLPRKNKHGIPM